MIPSLQTRRARFVGLRALAITAVLEGGQWRFWFSV
jgi:hypothetical protein